MTSTELFSRRLSVLLLYLPQKERWVVRPLSDPCDGFLSLKATNLSLQTRNTIVVLLANYSVHQYFVVQRLDYLCEVKEWGAVETMHTQAVEIAAEISRVHTRNEYNILSFSKRDRQTFL